MPHRRYSRAFAAAFLLAVALLPICSVARDKEAVGRRIKEAVAAGEMAEEEGRERYAEYLEEAASAKGDASASREPKTTTAMPSPFKGDADRDSPLTTP